MSRACDNLVTFSLSFSFSLINLESLSSTFKPTLWANNSGELLSYSGWYYFFDKLTLLSISYLIDSFILSSSFEGFSILVIELGLIAVSFLEIYFFVYSEIPYSTLALKSSIINMKVIKWGII